MLSEENLDYVDNDNEGDDDVDESSSGNEEMKNILKIGKKRGPRMGGPTCVSSYRSHL